MLKVSRSDVYTDTLQPFPVHSRFIKLPIENYLQLVDSWSQINRPQLALINAVNNPQYRFIVAALSRRLGKTYIANIIGQLVTLIPDSSVLIMSPNYNLSSISFELQRKFIKRFDLEVVRDNSKDRIIELSNGSSIRMGSVSQVDSCVGRSYDLIIFDEAALSNDGLDAFNVALRPTLDKPNSKAIFISTPRGKLNWFSEFFNRGYSQEYSDWCSIQADYHENPRMTTSDVESARLTMTKAEFEQEYCASFNTYIGKIYELPSQSVVAELTNELLLGSEFFAGLDPGYRDHTALVVCAYNHKLDLFVVVSDYLHRERTTEQHATAIRPLLQQYNCSVVFIDSAAAQFSADLAYHYDISTTKARKDVLPGIKHCQTLISSGKVLVYDKCHNVLAGLDQYRWDPRETLHVERPVHDVHSHTMDALRYALYSYVV